MQNPAPDQHAQTGCTAGIILVFSTLLSLVAMAHHPVLSGGGAAQAMEQLRKIAGLSGWVHGILIALILTSYWCLIEFSVQRGIHRPLVRAGLVAYGAGMVAMIGAAAISGWIAVGIPSLISAPTEQDIHVLGMLLNFCGMLNRTLADIGAVSMSGGIFFWSAGLLHSKGWPRIVGAIGILAGLVPALALISGNLDLDVHGMMRVLLLQAAWAIGVSVLLICRRVR